MGYENAAATVMLASFCACCSRPLVDAISVETGVGPECRRKHGFANAQRHVELTAETLASLPVEARAVVSDATDARTAVNRLVYRIALDQDGSDVNAFTTAVGLLGFEKLAARITKRLASIVVSVVDGGRIAVKTPFSEPVVAAMRSIPGRAWDREAKLNTFPTASKPAVWAMLRRCFPGATALGPKGLFTVTA